MRRTHPPVPLYSSGPNCTGCPFRETSFGYAPVTSPSVRVEIRDRVPHEVYKKIETPFLFLLEALGADEVEQGRNAIGATGNILNALLHENTPILRADQTIANVVRCRPVEWTVDELGTQVPMWNQTHSDWINKKPSPGQIRECAARYTDDMLARFDGKYIVGLGKTPLEYLSGRSLSVRKYRGTIFESGRLNPCVNCAGNGLVPRTPKKCQSCKGYGHTKCVCGGVSKHKKTCLMEWTECLPCAGVGAIVISPKECKECLGSGQVSADPANPFVSEKIKEGQVAFVTYHPAMLAREPAMWTIVARDFQRLASLDAEMVHHENTVYLVDPQDNDPVVSEMCAAPIVSVDLETHGKDPRAGEILCVGATHKIGWGCAIRVDDSRILDLLSRDTVVGQNFILYDMWWLHHHGFTIPETTRVVDTRFLGKLLNPDTPNDIYYLASEFADPPLRGYWKTRQDYRDHIEQVACMDVDATLRIFYGQLRALDERGQRSLADSYVVPISRIAFDIRRQGLQINTDELEKATTRIGEDLVELRAQLPDWGGKRSEGQHAKVHEWLYERLKLPTKRNRDSGKPTADAAALDALLGDINANGKNVAHLSDEEQYASIQFIELLQGLRGKSKLHGYFKAYALNRTGVLHPEANPVGTSTLRWTFQDPNCQQVPDCKCPERCYGTNPNCRGARYVFLPDEPDWEVMCVDLKQAEVIGMLWCAEQWAILRKILFEGMDAHFALAQQILGRDPTKQERADFKTTTFALLYGEADKTTAYRLGVSLDEVRRAREMYFRMLPGVADTRQSFIRAAVERGFVSSPFGVRRYIRVERETGRAANQAANAPIQNIPPMVIGQRMLRLARELPKPARLWIQVHDEVGLTYPKELRAGVESCVREVFKMPVKEMPASPLGMAGGLVFPIDIEVGANWGAVR